MKKLLLMSAIALCFSATTFAQSGVHYCDLTVFRPNFKNFVAKMNVDGNVRAKFTFLRDAAGKKIRFASESDAVNYAAKQGWELVTAYTQSHGSETHFILKKNSI